MVDFDKFGLGRGTTFFKNGGAGTLRLVIEVALLIAIGLVLAKLAISVFAPLPTPRGDMVSAAMSSPQGQRIQTTTEPKNPFGSAPMPNAPVEQAPEVAETSLNLKLTGVWPDGPDGSAIIRGEYGKDKRYAVGESISSGVRLVSVYEDQVIIEQNGVRESLRFESKIPAPKRSEPQNAAAALTVTPRELTDAIRMSSTTDDNGKPVIALNAGRNANVFTRIGFKNGDFLRTVNGEAAPSDPAGLLEMMNELSRESQATIVIERDGQRIPIVLSVRGNE
ncbi:type II secretion system protein N [Hyphococcus sp. DH-69]|uniref:type II secretion system protein N n=1 Tax=Hyphococcus formosus TaxID=3143534 RepID=UPI00398A8C48